MARYLKRCAPMRGTACGDCMLLTVQKSGYDVMDVANKKISYA